MSTAQMPLNYDGEVTQMATNMTLVVALKVTIILYVYLGISLCYRCCSTVYAEPLLYRVREKNILNVIDYHLKKRYPILIICNTNISGTTGHQMTVQYSTLPNVCFCTTWGKQNQQNMH